MLSSRTLWKVVVALTLLAGVVAATFEPPTTVASSSNATRVEPSRVPTISPETPKVETTKQASSGSNGSNGSNGQTTSSRGLLPTVQVDRAKNKSSVDVHVPIFFDMNNSHEEDSSKLNLSVLSGLVTVSRDKARKPNGQQVGPVKVTVFGIPIYTGHASSEPKSERSARLSRSSNSSQTADSEIPAEQLKKHTFLLGHLYELAQKVHHRVSLSLSDTFNKFTHTIGQKAMSVENVNGAPTDSTFVKKSVFTPEDLAPKNQTDVAGSAKSFGL